jgi:lysylphosphatidylglycerol synthetase-like protein (DUF2156 family)
MAFCSRSPRDKGGKAVAFCQFVPSPSIRGYSLDVMRRDDGDHPNGLFDFLIVSTIRYLDDEGFSGLGLNFATMRAVLAGEAGNGPRSGFDDFVLRRLSRSMQIESLWRFNAKYDPKWIARYVVYGATQELLPIAVAIIRAESLWDLPVVGKLFSPRSVAARHSLGFATLPESAGRSKLTRSGRRWIGYGELFERMRP